MILLIKIKFIKLKLLFTLSNDLSINDVLRILTIGILIIFHNFLTENSPDYANIQHFKLLKNKFCYNS